MNQTDATPRRVDSNNQNEGMILQGVNKMNFEIHKRAIVGVIGALLALTLMAGGAYAERGNGNGPQGPKIKGPQLSVDIINHCTIAGNLLTIDSTITETSDDEVFDITEADSAAVNISAIKRGKNVLGSELFSFPASEYANPLEIDLCDVPYIEQASKIKVMIALNFTFDGQQKSYTSGCDDLRPDGWPEVEDLVDESNLDISEVDCTP